MSNTNRQAGHDYERAIAARWRDLGYPRAATSRYTSRELDDQGVDLNHTGPWLIQCKRYAKAPQVHKILAELEETFKGQGKYPVVYWKWPRKGEVVCMRADDFEELILLLHHAQ